MCRFVAYLGPPVLLSEVVYKPPNSLVHQATDAMRSQTRINADGFGVGWYAPEISPEPAVFKDISPVWNNYNLGSIAGKIRSPCVMAHIRAAASFDPVNRENSHPFARGRLLWMHNGDIPGRARLARNVGQLADDTLLAMIRGNTDSEIALTLFLTHLNDPLAGAAPVEELASAMVETLEQIVAWHEAAGEERPLEMNFCVTDGHALVATRFALSDRPKPTLYYMIGNGADSGARFVSVASEPLNPEGPWTEVQENALLVIHPGLEVDERRLAIA